jgi:hypothetical protein
VTDYTLSKGNHTTPKDGRCAMEWVSYLAGEPHSDKPACVSPLLKSFCISFNDGLPDDKRQLLRPYLARTIGTAGDGLDEQRAWMAADWLIRVYTPTWLAKAGLDDAAERLRALPPVLAVENLSRAMEDLNSGRREADATGAAAWAATGAAAWAAAWAATGAATWAAAWAATGAATGDAAVDAAVAAAWDAAWDALSPTVSELQVSAFDLLDRMLPKELIQIPEVADWQAVCETPERVAA